MSTCLREAVEHPEPIRRLVRVWVRGPAAMVDSALELLRVAAPADRVPRALQVAMSDVQLPPETQPLLAGAVRPAREAPVGGLALEVVGEEHPGRGVGVVRAAVGGVTTTMELLVGSAAVPMETWISRQAPTTLTMVWTGRVVLLLPSLRQ